MGRRGPGRRRAAGRTRVGAAGGPRAAAGRARAAPHCSGAWEDAARPAGRPGVRRPWGGRGAGERGARASRCLGGERSRPARSAGDPRPRGRAGPVTPQRPKFDSWGVAKPPGVRLVGGGEAGSMPEAAPAPRAACCSRPSNQGVGGGGGGRDAGAVSTEHRAPHSGCLPGAPRVSLLFPSSPPDRPLAPLPRSQMLTRLRSLLEKLTELFWSFVKGQDLDVLFAAQDISTCHNQQVSLGGKKKNNSHFDPGEVGQNGA